MPGEIPGENYEIVLLNIGESFFKDSYVS